jgi:hypothetical protein
MTNASSIIVSDRREIDVTPASAIMLAGNKNASSIARVGSPYDSLSRAGQISVHGGAFGADYHEELLIGTKYAKRPNVTIRGFAMARSKYMFSSQKGTATRICHAQDSVNAILNSLLAKNKDRRLITHGGSTTSIGCGAPPHVCYIQIMNLWLRFWTGDGCRVGSDNICENGKHLSDSFEYIQIFHWFTIHSELMSRARDLGWRRRAISTRIFAPNHSESST